MEKPHGLSLTGFGDGKLVQGHRIESWQPQCENFNSNVGRGISPYWYNELNGEHLCWVYCVSSYILWIFFFLWKYMRLFLCCFSDRIIYKGIRRKMECERWITTQTNALSYYLASMINHTALDGRNNNTRRGNVISHYD